ncbi:MAG TPA: tetratricopeptide repeat protein [Hyphomicrobiaceae bacterium]|nr:tetratricopeptide repeat protein [Hyphomicrobiaceae bacterium]
MLRAAALLFCFVTISTAALATNDADRRDCSGESSPDRKIAACTRVLGDAKSAPALRVIAYRNRGITYNKKALHELATADFDEALKLDPKDLVTLAARGNAYSQRGMYDPALADLAEILRLNPRAGKAYNDRGLIHLRKGDLDAAASDFEAALQINPRSAHALNNRALVSARRGNFDDAIAGFSATLRADPQYLLAYTNRARAYEEKGELELALADLTAASQGVPRPNFEEDARAKANGARGVARLTPIIAERKAGLRTQPERRVALVVGNSRYAHAPALRNPAGDAKLLAQSLRESGFSQVRELYDADLSALGRALKDFGDLAVGSDWAVIYFAGHGIEVGGTNYLIPVDAKLETQAHVEDEAVPLSRVMSKVTSASKLQLIILDACRNNPFVPRMRGTGRTRSVGSGLTAIEPDTGVLVAYAARDGTTASDGEDTSPNSPYADALARHIGEQGLEISLLFRKVRDDVLTKTAKQQEPYTYGSLPAQPFYFRR